MRVTWSHSSTVFVDTDLPVMKRMFLEIPHVPIGVAIATGSVIGCYVYLNYYFDKGIGFQMKYTVLRPDDPRIPLYRDDVINADKVARS
ncbi:hypothetical protein ONE63_006328 [Megalurothrips usitatus]|uniref:Small integral membrane protein 20 n=1 Tax=Megalurothrips usitatus TaxID=439358 RepID=A0AAV7XW86_9NEOP|nr:hypothetical protein ONE63_006328 [Megalurothrips usitatus]